MFTSPFPKSNHTVVNACVWFEYRNVYYIYVYTVHICTKTHNLQTAIVGTHLCKTRKLIKLDFLAKCEMLVTLCQDNIGTTIFFSIEGIMTELMTTH